MQNFDSFLSSLTIGSPIAVNALSVYPLLRSSADAPFYDTLSDAVRAGTLHITEVSAAGSVPELRVVNDGKRPVLIIDGEELVGAKQNRIVNLTVLVPEGTTIPLPVTCVEAGRWRHVSDEFAPADEAMTVLRECGIHHLPVVREGRLVGIIAPVDVLRFYVDHILPKPPEAG